MHAYSMKDCARERYIFYLAIFAVAAAAVAKQAAGYFGVAVSVTTITLFTIIFLVFDRWLWRLPPFSTIVAIPDLAGDWTITGKTDGADGQPRTWSADARIEQTWSRIAISIETPTSRSRSGMTAVERDPGHGFRVIYGYGNEPKSTDGGLRPHRGMCEVVFSSDLTYGEGTYFNDHQRRTVGTMVWKRVRKNGAKHERV